MITHIFFLSNFVQQRCYIFDNKFIKTDLRLVDVRCVAAFLENLQGYIRDI